MNRTLKIKIKFSDLEAEVIKKMCHDAALLFNECNLERLNYKSLGLERTPSFYEQTAKYLNSSFTTNLNTYTAEQVIKACKDDWLSYFEAKKAVPTTKPPSCKEGLMPITCRYKGVIYSKRESSLRIVLPELYQKTLGKETILIKNKVFSLLDKFVQIIIFPPIGNVSLAYVIHDKKMPIPKKDNGRYLVIDMGCHNLFTCYDTHNDKSFIVGRGLMALARKYNKMISNMQREYAKSLKANDKAYHLSKRFFRVNQKKKNVLETYLHTTTKYIIDYCKEEMINTIIIGDIMGVTKNYGSNATFNQNLGELTYDRIYHLLEYKAVDQGINFIKQEEAYTSQCSPYSQNISKDCAEPTNRVSRGCYKIKDKAYNADVVGAYNIYRKYLLRTGKILVKPITAKGLIPKVVKLPIKP